MKGSGHSLMCSNILAFTLEGLRKGTKNLSGYTIFKPDIPNIKQCNTQSNVV
jgi:hypothetical protein